MDTHRSDLTDQVDALPSNSNEVAMGDRIRAVETVESRSGEPERMLRGVWLCRIDFRR
jgi:hypothetical protein